MAEAQKQRKKRMEICNHQVIIKNIWNEKIFTGKFYDNQEADAFFKSVFSYFSLPQETREGLLWQKLDEELG